MFDGGGAAWLVTNTSFIMYSSVLYCRVKNTKDAIELMIKLKMELKMELKIKLKI